MIPTITLKKINFFILLVDLGLLTYWAFLIYQDYFSIELSVILGIVSVIIAIQSGIIAEQSKKRMDTIGDVEIERTMKSLALYYDSTVNKINNVGLLNKGEIKTEKDTLAHYRQVNDAFITSFKSFASDLRILLIYKEYLKAHNQKDILYLSLMNTIHTIKYFKKFNEGFEIEVLVESQFNKTLTNLNKIFSFMKDFNRYGQYNIVFDKISNSINTEKPLFCLMDEIQEIHELFVKAYTYKSS